MWDGLRWEHLFTCHRIEVEIISTLLNIDNYRKMSQKEKVISFYKFPLPVHHALPPPPTSPPITSPVQLPGKEDDPPSPHSFDSSR